MECWEVCVWVFGENESATVLLLLTTLGAVVPLLETIFVLMIVVGIGVVVVFEFVVVTNGEGLLIAESANGLVLPPPINGEEDVSIK